MIIEIGTSDFRTQAGKQDGIFIEPVKYYFDRLPDCNKVNCAVSNYTGMIKMYYLTDSEINKYNLPEWVRGCNSVKIPHKSVVDLLKVNDIPGSVIHCDIVPVKRIADIISEYNVTSIKLLKVDTEGHDCVIVNDYLDTVEFLPDQIFFEANSLTPNSEVVQLISRLNGLGYSCKKYKYNVCAKR